MKKESAIGYAIIDSDNNYYCANGYYIWDSELVRARIYPTKEKAQKKMTELKHETKILMIKMRAIETEDENEKRR